MTKPVFISYATDDTAVAEQIRDGLKVSGIPCWMAPRDIAPGLEYGGQIIDAIEACRVLLLVLSESANRSRFVLNEVERTISDHAGVWALSQDIKSGTGEVRPSQGLEADPSSGNRSG